MDLKNPSTSSSLPNTEPETSRVLYLKNFLDSHAVDLQNRENRQNLEFIKNLLQDLQEIKFECLNSDKEICNLFATISKKAEICEQQLQINKQNVNSEEFVSSRRKRRRRKLRESFGFSQFKNEECSDDDFIIEISGDEDEPDYLKHFEMEKKKNEEMIWGQQTCQIEDNGLESEFKDVKYTELNHGDYFGKRINVVKE